MVAQTRRTKPDPEALYEATKSYSRGRRVYQAGTRLRGDHEEVRASFGSWMLVDLPDDQKARIRSESNWSRVTAEEAARQGTSTPLPVAQPPTGRFRAVRSWSLADPDLAATRGRINAGDVVDADDEVFKRYPQLFVAHIEERRS